MKRMKPDKRRSHILFVAIELSKKNGYRNITREEVARAASVSNALINAYFGTIEDLKKCVIQKAVKDEIPIIIAQHLAVADDHSVKISERLRKKAADFLRSSYVKNT